MPQPEGAQGATTSRFRSWSRQVPWSDRQQRINGDKTSSSGLDHEHETFASKRGERHSASCPALDVSASAAASFFTSLLSLFTSLSLSLSLCRICQRQEE